MYMDSLDNFPTLEEFLSYSNEEIQNFTRKFSIKTCYLPVDGTRRHFILYSSSVSSWNESHLQDYYKHVNENFRTILSQFYDYGLQDIIVLLMDKSAFSRGKAFLTETIKNGIKPLYEDSAYVDLYNKYNIEVYFSGFNEVYKTYYEPELLEELERNFEKLKRPKGDRKLLVYTGLSPSEDYLLFERLAQDLRRENIPVTKENMIKKIYHTNLSAIDFSIWFGYPRDKLIPPLLWEDGTNLFIKNPTLTLKPVQIKKAIYYSAITKDSIKDKYFNHNFTEQKKNTLLNEVQSTDAIMGEEYYL